MTDEKQIEEMAEWVCSYNCDIGACLGSCVTCDNKKLAKELVEQGYRKLPRNAVVMPRIKYILAKEFVEQGYRMIPDKMVVLVKEERKHKKNSLYYSRETLENKLAQARKEMAREIINFIEDLKVPEDGRHEWRDRHNETIERIIPKLNQKFIDGVEVEE